MTNVSYNQTMKQYNKPRKP